MTIVDALVVTLGLDAAAFKRGKAEASRATKQLTAEEARAAKEIEARNKRAAESFRAIRREILALGVLLTAGLGIKGLVDFTGNTVKGAIATGQLARELGMVPGNLRAVEQSFDRLGSSTADADAALKGIQQQAAKLRSGEFDDRLNAYLLNASWAGVKGASPTDANDPMKKLERDAEIAQQLAKKMGSGFAIYRMEQEGYSESMAYALMKGPQALQAEIKRQSKLNELSQEETQRLRALDNRWKDFRAGIGNTAQRIVIAMTPAFDTIMRLLDRLANWLNAHADQIGAQVQQMALQFAAWVKSVNWGDVIKEVKSFFATLDRAAQSLGGWKVVLGALIALKVLSIVSPVLQLAGALSSLGGSLGIIGRLGPAAIAVLAGLGIAKLFGLPDTDKSKGAEDIKKGKWLKASADLPAADFLKAVANRAIGIPDAALAAHLSGLKARQQEAFGYFVSHGWSQAQAAGIVGSLTQESNVDPTVANAKSGAYGIGQWLDPSRLAAFKKWAGHDIMHSTFQEQLGFMQYELTQGSYKRAGDRLRAATTAAAAAKIHSDLYEAPGAAEANIAKRQAYAQQIYASLGQANAAKIAQQTAVASSAATRAPASVSHNTSTSEAHINGPINIHTQATDAQSIAREFGQAVRRHFFVGQANTGLS